MNGKSDFLYNFWKSLKEFQFRYPTMHKVFAVCDADDDCAAELAGDLQRRAARLGTLPFPLIFHVITRELETWWITEANAISSAIGVMVPFPGGNVEQDILDPKQYLLHRRAPTKAPYTSRDAAAAARAIDLTTLRQRSPGFVRFARRVENGSARSI